ncbi:hypothetical protein [Spirillospora sp. CA-294931]|uniref:hypothetical protein n=1 Tax=Spirillospora sp. CA-294931 TaxID=3240042 RepID=UPI003D9080DE
MRTPRMDGPWIWVVLFVVLTFGVTFWGQLFAGDDSVRRPTFSYSPSPEVEPVATIPPRIKGWKAVESQKYALAYDVPSAWRVRSVGLLVGFEPRAGRQMALASSVAAWREDHCATERVSQLAGTGFQQYSTGKPADVARNAADKWTVDAYTPEHGNPPAVRYSGPKPVKVSGVKGFHVQADAKPTPGGKSCLPPRAVVHVVALPGRATGKTTVFVIWSDQGVPGAVPPRELKRILASLRSAGPKAGASTAPG